MLCVPAVEDAVNNLTSAEAHNYFSKAISGKLQISVDPPVQPKGGNLYIYNLGPDSDKWEQEKKKLRLGLDIKEYSYNIASLSQFNKTSLHNYISRVIQ